jgi:hypothetical protein
VAIPLLGYAGKIGLADPHGLLQNSGLKMVGKGSHCAYSAAAGPKPDPNEALFGRVFKMKSITTFLIPEGRAISWCRKYGSRKESPIEPSHVGDHVKTYFSEPAQDGSSSHVGTGAKEC